MKITRNIRTPLRWVGFETNWIHLLGLIMSLFNGYNLSHLQFSSTISTTFLRRTLGHTNISLEINYQFRFFKTPKYFHFWNTLYSFFVSFFNECQLYHPCASFLLNRFFSSLFIAEIVKFRLIEDDIHSCSCFFLLKTFQ